MIKILLCFFLPPILLLRYSNKIFLSLLSLTIWWCAIYFFLERSVSLGIVIYLALVTLVLYLTFQKYTGDKTQLKIKTHWIMVLLPLITLAFFTSTIVKRNIQGKTNLAKTQYSLTLGKQIYDDKCSLCHKLNDGNYVGPSLKGIFMRPAGKYPNYNYSKNLQTANFVWDEQKLVTFLNDQNGLIPETRMYISPLTNEELITLIHFLKNEQ
ncbi:c-type cytochrome [Paraglaciecola arctica]|uniref:c-type cytochrome n=1 Tax=Paraglaciecola arctica TaxID=1128911 RepID=UPI001C073F3B|nr:c-type cytochrome [Paraglaciecola arctica]MBU3004338.1 c-type cytochrome [Paraglaciecola arctica]